MIGSIGTEPPGGGAILPPPPSGGATAPGTFTYIERGDDLWTGWPDVNQKTITGTLGLGLLSDAFDLVAASGANAVTDDLFRKGISTSFDGGFFEPGAICQDALACHLSVPAFLPPAEPGVKPLIVFNPVLLTETVAAIAGVLVHEGTHFQQYLDGSLHSQHAGTLTVVDTEFRAFWNQAVFWGEVRDGEAPHTTFLENQMESVYDLAQQGESALRNEIAARYS